GDGGRRGQGDEGIHHVVVLLGQVAALGKGRAARERNVRVLGRPHRLEAALLEGPRQLGGGHRVVREEDRGAEVHRASGGSGGGGSSDPAPRGSGRGDAGRSCRRTR